MNDQPAPSLHSLRSSILQHQEENGRTYHAMSSGSKLGLTSVIKATGAIVITNLSYFLFMCTNSCA